jgi:hypothetical protein
MSRHPVFPRTIYGLLLLISASACNIKSPHKNQEGIIEVDQVRLAPSAFYRGDYIAQFTVKNALFDSVVLFFGPAENKVYLGRSLELNNIIMYGEDMDLEEDSMLVETFSLPDFRQQSKHDSLVAELQCSHRDSIVLSPKSAVVISKLLHFDINDTHFLDDTNTRSQLRMRTQVKAGVLGHDYKAVDIDDIQVKFVEER